MTAPPTFPRTRPYCTLTCDILPVIAASATFSQKIIPFQSYTTEIQKITTFRSDFLKMETPVCEIEFIGAERKRGRLKTFDGVRIQGVEFFKDDTVLLKSDVNSFPYIGRIKHFRHSKGQIMVKIQWFYRISDTHLRTTRSFKNEIFESSSTDMNNVRTIMRHVNVSTTVLRGNKNWGPFFCNKKYDPKTQEFTPLSASVLARREKKYMDGLFTEKKNTVSNVSTDTIDKGYLSGLPLQKSNEAKVMGNTRQSSTIDSDASKVRSDLNTNKRKVIETLKMHSSYPLDRSTKKKVRYSQAMNNGQSATTERMKSTVKTEKSAAITKRTDLTLKVSNTVRRLSEGDEEDSTVTESDSTGDVLEDVKVPRIGARFQVDANVFCMEKSKNRQTQFVKGSVDNFDFRRKRPIKILWDPNEIPTARQKVDSFLEKCTSYSQLTRCYFPGLSLCVTESDNFKFTHGDTNETALPNESGGVECCVCMQFYFDRHSTSTIEAINHDLGNVCSKLSKAHQMLNIRVRLDR